MSEDATLRDSVTAEPSESKETKTEPASKETTVTEPADKTAEEIGQIILSRGFTKEQLNDLMDAPGALGAIRNLIETNPEEFMNMLQRTAPEVHSKFEDALAERYVRLHEDKTRTTSGDDKEEPNKELMQELRLLREKVNASEQRESQRETNAAMAAAKSRYDDKVTSLFEQLPKDLNLTKSEVKALKADLNAELAADPSVVKRIANGNYVDVSKKFADILKGWSDDRKAAAEAETKRREGVDLNSFAELLGGPNSLVDIPANAADSWEATESGLARALDKLARGK